MILFEFITFYTVFHTFFRGHVIVFNIPTSLSKEHFLPSEVIFIKRPLVDI